MREVTEERFALENFRRTGPEAHVNEVLSALETRCGPPSVDDAPYSSEEEIYEAAGMEFVPAEMRERGRSHNGIVTKEDLQGDRGCAPYSWTDHQRGGAGRGRGVLGHSYICLCDRLGAWWTGEAGKEERADRRGELALADHAAEGSRGEHSSRRRLEALSLLEEMDLVVASVNTKLNMGEDEMRTRIIRAWTIQRGRAGQSQRPGPRSQGEDRHGPPPHCRECLRERVAGINAHPDRQDLDDNDANGLMS